MLEIVNERGEVMELVEDTTIPMERNNPLFSDLDKFTQDIVYPGKAPISPANKSFFQNGHLVDAINSAYEFPVDVKLNGFPMFRGVCQYFVTKGYFDFTLKLNYGAIHNKLKTVRLPQIESMDVPWSNKDEAFLTALMKDTCVNPQNHNFVFPPITNPGFDTSTFVNSNKLVNYYNHTTQAFLIDHSGTSSGYKTAECPQFKLVYILKKLAEYFKLKITGSFLTDPEANKILVYSRNTLFSNNNFHTLLPSMFYMPNITITDFLRALKDRLHLPIDFDLANGEITIESLSYLLYESEVVELGDYIEVVDRIEVPTVQGYEVSLKPEADDKLFRQTFADDDSQVIPSNKLVIGNGETKMEIKCSTLKADTAETIRKRVATNQPVISNSYINSGLFQPSTPGDPTTRNNWALRFFKYNGMVEYEAGKFWPESIPMELGAEDTLWYQFLNSGKPFHLIANIPPDVLQKLKSTKRISFFSKEGAYVEALITKINCDLGRNRSLVRTKIECRSLKIVEAGVAYISSNSQEISSDKLANYKGVKIYFDPAVISEVKIDCYVSNNTQVRSSIFTVTQPTDEMGAGGQTVFLPRSKDSQTLDRLTIYSNVAPKFISFNGIMRTITPNTVNGNIINYNCEFSAPISNNLEGLISEGVYWLVF